MSKIRCEKCDKKIKSEWLEIINKKELKQLCEVCYYKDLSEYYLDVIKKQNINLLKISNKLEEKEIKISELEDMLNGQRKGIEKLLIEIKELRG